jgi:hypothetical protein
MLLREMVASYVYAATAPPPPLTLTSLLDGTSSVMCSPRSGGLAWSLGAHMMASDLFWIMIDSWDLIIVAGYEPDLDIVALLRSLACIILTFWCFDTRS